MRRPATSCALRLSWSSVGSHWSETRAHRSRSRRSRRRAATAVRSPMTGSPTKSASASRTSPATIRVPTVRNSRTPPEGERSPAPAALPTMPGRTIRRRSHPIQRANPPMRAPRAKARAMIRRSPMRLRVRCSIPRRTAANGRPTRSSRNTPSSTARIPRTAPAVSSSRRMSPSSRVLTMARPSTSSAPSNSPVTTSPMRTSGMPPVPTAFRPTSRR